MGLLPWNKLCVLFFDELFFFQITFQAFWWQCLQVWSYYLVLSLLKNINFICKIIYMCLVFNFLEYRFKRKIKDFWKFLKALKFEKRNEEHVISFCGIFSCDSRDWGFTYYVVKINHLFIREMNMWLGKMSALELSVRRSVILGTVH